MAEVGGPEEIRKEDLEMDAPDVGGTEIIIQRHEEYIRDKDHPEAGGLPPEARERAYNQTVSNLNRIMEQLSPEQRRSLDVMVIGSPTRYLGSGGMRSMETASAVLEGVRSVISNNDLSSEQVLNDQARLKANAGQPIPSQKIVEPRVFEDSPEFVEWLKQARGNGEINKDFWKAFEDDEGEVREKREEMKAEGPREMADRLANFTYALKRFAEKHHEKHPDRRLILWAVSHYDTISPFVKTRIGGGKDGYLPVDYGGGIGINIKSGGEASTKIGGVTYPLELAKSETASSTE
jgi:hypothetical protein